MSTTLKDTYIVFKITIFCCIIQEKCKLHSALLCTCTRQTDTQVLHKALLLPIKLPQTVTAQCAGLQKKSVIADAFLFFGTPLHVKSFAEPTWSALSSITIAQLALVAIT